MARQARGEYLDPSEVQVVHAVQRCVRRAFLCGKDPLTGKSFEYRRQWIRDRLEFLASVFGIDCLTYTVMSNHLHVVLRSRPDVVKEWSDDQVARRWWRLFPKRRDANKQPVEPRDHELAMITGDARSWPRSANGCRILAGGCGVRRRTLLGEATRTINVRADFGRVDFEQCCCWMKHRYSRARLTLI